MKILYLSQYFPPEVGATQTRSYEMAKHLVDHGNEVTVITEVPNHPVGIIHSGFRGVLFKRLDLEGIDVIHVWVMAFEKKCFLTRMLFYFSYVFMATLVGLYLCRGSYDLIYATSPPLPVGLAALVLHRLKKIPLFFEVRDLWPDSAVELGLLNNKVAIKLATCLEEICYRASTKIVVVTDGIRERLIKRGIKESKVVIIPNGTNVRKFNRSDADGDIVKRTVGLMNRYVILYAGILGVSQGLETMIEAAKLLSHEPEYFFLMVGDGPMAEKLKQDVSNLQLTNILFVGGRAREEMPAFYSAAQMTIVPLKRLEIFRHARPTKLFDAMACETPVVLGIEGEAKEILEKAEGGIPYIPEDAEDLVRSIREIVRLGESGQREMGKRGRRYVAAYYSRDRYARDLERVLYDSI